MGKTFYIFIFFTGYFLLVNVSYPSKVTPLAYIEGMYVLLSLFLSLPFIFDVLPMLQKRKVAIPIYTLILMTGCARIYLIRPVYEQRIAWEKNFLRKHRATKMIADDKKANAEILQMTWGTPYEFCLLSTLEYNKTASIILDSKPADRAWAAGMNKSFIVNWNIYQYKDLPDNYFHFDDTTTGYLIDPPL